ncbi:MAG TPA: thiol-disulfide isomerase [Bryobacteraceae bacterium]
MKAFPLLLLAALSVPIQAASPTFYRDILPILQARCQNCHRKGERTPMPLVTYRQVKPFAAAIRKAVRSRTMPPWFADPCCGHFSNNPSLTKQEIAAISAWVDAGAPAGNPHDAPPPVHWTKGWRIAKPDVVFTMPVAAKIPASGDTPYKEIIIPTHFKKNRWVQMCEIRPGNSMAVHHAVAYVRPPNSNWLRGAPIGVPFSANQLPTPKLRRDAQWTTSEVLLLYAPGSPPGRSPTGFAKFIPAGSDIVLQMHYMTMGHPMEDRTSIGLVFAKNPPHMRVLTLQLTNDTFTIPPGDPDMRVGVHGSIPNDCLLLSLFPHMHLRGKTFTYYLDTPGKPRRTLLLVHYNFRWQLHYRLAKPIPLKTGDILQAVATFDNSGNNPDNPNPSVAVSWGDQSSSGMMIGFFNVAVPAGIDKKQFFVRKRQPLK